MARHTRFLTDEQRSKIKPLLPNLKPGRKRGGSRASGSIFGESFPAIWTKPPRWIGKKPFSVYRAFFHIACPIITLMGG